MSAAAPPPVCLPPGLTLKALISVPVTFLVIVTTLSGLMWPLLLALFLFSTPNLRRSAVFWLNVASVVLGIGQGIYHARNDIRTIMNPLLPEATETFIASAVLLSAGTIFVDSILFLRLVAVYPFRDTPRLKWFALIAIPVAGLIVRIVNISVFGRRVQVAVTNDLTVEGDNIIQKFNNILIEWISQLIMNSYMSAAFLWRMYSHHLNTKSLRSANGSGSTRSSISFSSRLVELMWIAVFNFVPPVILNLVQLLVYYVRLDFIDASYVLQVNFHVSIIGVVLATVWVSGTRWASEHTQHDLRGALSTMGFASNPAGGGSQGQQQQHQLHFAARRPSRPQRDELSTTDFTETFQSEKDKPRRPSASDIEAKPVPGRAF